MKKSTLKDQEQGGRKRRLTLSRETIKALHEPALQLARGGASTSMDGGSSAGADLDVIAPTCT